MNTILVIEDNELNLKLMVDILTINGYQTLAARSGEEGMSLLATQTPDLILMDIRMPSISGIEALGRIKANTNLNSIPVIAVTASVMNHDKQLIFAAGFNDFLQKPIEIPVFLETIRKHLAA
jgi:two-component system cell cycle response regulator DivK